MQKNGQRQTNGQKIENRLYSTYIVKPNGNLTLRHHYMKNRLNSEKWTTGKGQRGGGRLPRSTY